MVAARVQEEEVAAAVSARVNAREQLLPPPPPPHRRDVALGNSQGRALGFPVDFAMCGGNLFLGRFCSQSSLRISNFRFL